MLNNELFTNNDWMRVTEVSDNSAFIYKRIVCLSTNLLEWDVKKHLFSHAVSSLFPRAPISVNRFFSQYSKIVCSGWVVTELNQNNDLSTFEQWYIRSKTTIAYTIEWWKSNEIKLCWIEEEHIDIETNHERDQFYLKRCS